MDAERKGCRMKIEKVNENQIRCTLTREDLASRQLKISELAYGTEKAKTLFRDMMQQANFEFGFEAEDIPLMIEAIPLNAECIVLIITKVEDPEELDTRFSRFAPSLTEDYDEESDEDLDSISSDLSAPSQEILDALKQRLQGAPDITSANPSGEKPEQTENDAKRTRIFRMSSLQQVMEVSKLTGRYYKGLSSLYKDEQSEQYLLVLTQGGEEKKRFDRICNAVSEYGVLQRVLAGNSIYLEEHFEALVKENALNVLGF